MESDSNYSADELGQYQSLSTSAVVALVLGLLSVVAFAAPLLLVVPLFAVAVALWALARIKRSEGGLLGTRLAYGGLAFAIIFGVSAVARVEVRTVLLRREAKATAELWMAKVARGESEEAMGLMTRAAVIRLQSSGSNIGAVPIFSEAIENAQLLQDPLVLALRKMHESGNKSRVLRETQVDSKLSQPRAVFVYDVLDAEAEVSSFLLVLSKTKGLHSPSVWLIDRWQVGDGSH